MGDKGGVCPALRSEARRKVSLCNFRVGISRGKKEGPASCLPSSLFPLFRIEPRLRYIILIVHSLVGFALRRCHAK